MNLPTPGPQPQKERFFTEVAQSFQFLAAYYALTVEQQQQILASMNKMLAQRRHDG